MARVRIISPAACRGHSTIDGFQQRGVGIFTVPLKKRQKRKRKENNLGLEVAFVGCSSSFNFEKMLVSLWLDINRALRVQHVGRETAARLFFGSQFSWAVASENRDIKANDFEDLSGQLVCTKDKFPGSFQVAQFGIRLEVRGWERRVACVIHWLQNVLLRTSSFRWRMLVTEK